MLYGFRPPKDDDVVFRIAGELEKVRVLDYVVRGVASAAVQSTLRDGLRHWWAEGLSWATARLASAVEKCYRRKIFRPVGWLLKLFLYPMVYLAARAGNADFLKRTFVKDADGTYTLLFNSPSMEHAVRACANQLGVGIVNEKFPPGAYRSPKPERNGSFTFSFSVCGRSGVIDLQS